MTAIPIPRDTSPIDPLALVQFLVRSQAHLVRMQAALAGHSPIVDARALQRIVQWSREIAVGAEVAGLPRLAHAADDVENLAVEALVSTTPDPIALGVRLGEKLRVLGARIEAEFLPDAD